MKEYLPSEKEVESSIVKLLRQLGFAVYKNSQPRVPLVTSGIPDLMVFCPKSKPGYFFLEVKTERKGSKLRPAQKDFQAECERAAIGYKVWRSVDKDCWNWLVEEGYVVESKL
jgi:hypothetical protein|tara:strand:+ start:106 stop:444 length:339 start_codon:yes stop_codon:yes gene_type:complete